MAEKRIIVASSKGGVGKSTVSCGLAFALARRGKRVLLVDCDFGNRCLDLMLAHENEVIYNLSDVAEGRITPSRALIHLSDFGELYFVPAPPCSGEATDFESVCDALRLLEKTADADYVICDTSSGVTVPLELANRYADSALIVATQSNTSLRAADNLAAMLTETPVEFVRLIVSVFDVKDAASGARPGLITVVMDSGVRTIGVVPYDKRLIYSVIPPKKEKLRRKSVSCAAFANIAGRLCGEEIPLFNTIKSLRRRLVL